MTFTLPDRQAASALILSRLKQMQEEMGLPEPPIDHLLLELQMELTVYKMVLEIVAGTEGPYRSSSYIGLARRKLAALHESEYGGKNDDL